MYLKFSEDTAQRYIGLYKRRDQIPQGAVFEVTEAYRLLSQPAVEPEVAPDGTLILPAIQTATARRTGAPLAYPEEGGTP